LGTDGGEVTWGMLKVVLCTSFSSNPKSPLTPRQ